MLVAVVVAVGMHPAVLVVLAVVGQEVSLPVRALLPQLTRAVAVVADGLTLFQHQVQVVQVL